MPFTGTDEIHMRAPTCKYADSKSGFNDMVGIEIRYRQGNLAVFFYFGWRRHSRIVSLPHGESVRRHSPSFPWKEVPRRGGGWNCRSMKGNMRKAVSRIVIPSVAEGSFSFVIFCFMRESVCMKHRSSDSQGARCFPLSAAPHPLPCRERKRFLASLEMTIRGKRYSQFVDFPIGK